MPTRLSAGSKINWAVSLIAICACLGLTSCGGGGGAGAGVAPGTTAPITPDVPPPVSIPSTPTNVVAVGATSSQVDLTWTASTGDVPVTGYNIFRNGAAIPVATVGIVTDYQDTGLTPSTNYSYRIQAINALGNRSSLSTAAGATTLVDIQDPTLPTNLAALAVSPNQINLSWTAATDDTAVTGYRIYRDGTLIATLGNVLSFQNTGLTLSTLYSYTVEAIDAAGNASGQTGAATATTPAGADTQAPTLPTNLTATVISSVQVNLSWTAATDNIGVTNYRIFRGGVLIATLGNVLTYQNTGLTPSTNYSYTVQALDAPGNASGQSLPALAATPGDALAPTVPTNLTATAISPVQINLSWTAATDNVGVTGYRVYRGGVLIATLGNVLTFQNSGLTASTLYSYTVEAFDAAGNSSAQTAPATATTPAASGNISLSLVPARTAGVAPLSVFFDATGTTAPTLTPRPFHDIEYQWNFGDPLGSPVLGTTWSTGSRAGSSSRNLAKGPVTAHVFERPGTYTVTLSARHGANTAATTTTITVTDPNTVFAGTLTACFSNNTDFTGCPTGANQVTTSNFITVTNAAATTSARRLLMRRGHTFTVSGNSGRISDQGPGILGAFGPSTSPIPVVRALTNNAIVQTSSSTVINPIPFGDWRIMDMELDGGGFPLSAVEAIGEGIRETLLRLYIHDVAMCMNDSVPLLDIINSRGGSLHEIWDQKTMQDVTCLRANTNGAVQGTRRLAFLGNYLSDMGGNAHLHRMGFVVKGVVSNNTYRNQAVNGGHTKFHGPLFNSTGVDGTPGGTGSVSELALLSDNLYVGGPNTGNILVHLGPTNAQRDERVRDVIFERNWFRSGAGTLLPLLIEGDNITIRNNLCDTTGAPGPTCINVRRQGAEPPHSDIRIYHNVGYNASPVSFTFIGLQGGVSNVFVQNNLASAPFGSGTILGINGATGVVPQNNLFTNVPGFVGTMFPGVQFGAAADFIAGAGRDVGLTFPLGPPVFEDFFGSLRPINGNADIGISEQ